MKFKEISKNNKFHKTYRLTIKRNFLIPIKLYKYYLLIKLALYGFLLHLGALIGGVVSSFIKPLNMFKRLTDLITLIHVLFFT